MPNRALVAFFALTALLGVCLASADDGPRRPVVTASVEGVVNPVTAEFVVKSIEKAKEEDAEALVILLDTPGGLDTSMRDMVKAIVGSEVPVVTYVSPSGARAASAGLFIVLASHAAAMAPGTNIGAAHPVSVDGKQMDEVMTAKVENDASAYIRSLAEKRGRNAEWAEKAVRESVSASETEALGLGVIDLVAGSLDDLLGKLDGRVVETAYGERTLATKGARVVRFEMNWRQKFLKTITNPDVAYVLMMLGMLGMYLELSNPGLILPGVVGGVALLLSFYAFNTLPVNYAGLLLILLGVVLFILEVKVVSFGMLTLSGVVCLALGSVMLIDSPLPYMQISLGVILPVVLVVSLFMAIIIRVAVRSLRSKVSTGREGIIGEEGEALTEVLKDGSVYVLGTYWSAYSDVSIQKGTRVVVEAIEGLRLKVRPKDQ